MGDCLDKKSLEQLAEGEFSGQLRASAEAHVEMCRRCAEALARLPMGDDLLAAIRDLETAREQIAPELAKLTDTEERVTTTLFGPASS